MIYAVTSRFIQLKDKEHFSKFESVPKTIIDSAESVGVKLVSLYNPLNNILSICEGLIVTGSSINIHPSYYGKSDETFHEDIDEFELDDALIRWFIDHEKPVLGICGGLQSINVAFGGSLKKVDGHDKVTHDILIKDTTGFMSNYGEKYTVNSFHHYAIDELAKGLRTTAVSPDGVVEAIEGTKSKVIAVQWHPEEMEGTMMEELLKYTMQL